MPGEMESDLRPCRLRWSGNQGCSGLYPKLGYDGNGLDDVMMMCLMTVMGMFGSCNETDKELMKFLTVSSNIITYINLYALITR